MHPLPSAAPILAGAAADLRMAALLHDREIDKETAGQLATTPAVNWLNLALIGEDAEAGFKLIDGYWAEAGGVNETTLDELAADYADIYLTFGKRVAPNESYWLTIDHIERQEPMFNVRTWYEHYGLGAQDWRKRADDHLVHEMEFVALLLEQGSTSAWLDAGRFLDQHLLRWSPDFFAGAAKGASTAFYAGVAIVSHCLLLNIRSLLETVTGEARRKVDAAVAEEADTAPFIPGAAESW